MFKLKMKFQIFLMYVLFIGIGVKASVVDRCRQMITRPELELLMELEVQEQFNVFCRNMTNYFSCLNDVMRENTGLSLKEAADFLKSHPMTKSFRLLVNVVELIEDICTEGSELNEGYLSNIECFQNVSQDTQNTCQEQVRNATEIFRELQTGIEGQISIYASCVVAAYHMGCVGSNIHEKCGEQGFHVFKEIIKKIGIFKSGACSSDVIQMIKTTLMDRLNMSDSQRILYQTIVELRRRKK